MSVRQCALVVFWRVHKIWWTVSFFHTDWRESHRVVLQTAPPLPPSIISPYPQLPQGPHLVPRIEWSAFTWDAWNWFATESSCTRISRRIEGTRFSLYALFPPFHRHHSTRTRFPEMTTFVVRDSHFDSVHDSRNPPSLFLINWRQVFLLNSTYTAPALSNKENCLVFQRLKYSIIFENSTSKF